MLFQPKTQIFLFLQHKLYKAKLLIMRLHRLLSLSWIVWVLIFGYSCKSPASYQSETYFENQIWNRFDIQEYTIIPDKKNKDWDVFFLFDHLDSYYTDHIAVNITFYLPQGGTRSRDYTFRLKDDALDWTGIQNGKTISHELSLIKGFSFDASGPLKIRVESKMTKFNLTAVKKVGMLIKAVEN